MSSMDPHSILDKGASQELPVAGSPQPGWSGSAEDEPPPAGEVRFPAEDGGKSLAEMAQRDFNATLQLLAERAQYITAATGAAIALRDHEEMVCRASAGTSAPEVGARLQTNSGLSGESIRTRQTLRCDDAATDTRVNRESCEALGIASVVVMPLVHGTEVIGVFELFSDKPNVFEARDIAALERMGSMVFTALEQATAAHSERVEPEGAGETPAMPVEDPAAELTSSEETMGEPVPSAEARPVDPEVVKQVEPPAAEVARRNSGIVFHRSVPTTAAPIIVSSVAPKIEVVAEPVPAPVEDEDILGDVAPPVRAHGLDSVAMVGSPASAESAEETQDLDVLDMGLVSAVRPVETAPAASTTIAAERAAPAASPVRSAVASLRKCEACGFPVSEGRQLCLDCEKKQRAGDAGARWGAQRASAASGGGTAQGSKPLAAADSAADTEPGFLDGEQEEPSWLASHKYMVGAILIAVAAIVVVLLIR